MRFIRIGVEGFPVFDGTGAKLNGGRWNSPGKRVIYAAPNISCARLEVIVGLYRKELSQKFFWTEIRAPDEISSWTVRPSDLIAGWDGVRSPICRQIGDQWLAAGEAALLFVPSVASPGEINVLINQDHPQFGLMTATDPLHLTWDPRLIQKLFRT
jgi:RES domain-containing protein